MNKITVFVQDLTELTPTGPTFVAIGSFDGVHRGHQALLQRMVAAAHTAGAHAAALTFFPHPRRVIQQLTDPYYLARLEDRLRWLGDTGVDLVISHPFNAQVQQMRAVEFVDRLCAHLQMRELWGTRLALGRNREGNEAKLRELGESRDYTVHQLPDLVQWKGAPVSSSRIRRTLRDGAMVEVNGCLGRPYLLRGTVILGDQRGRTIGFPTANIDFWPEQLLPANGVYATYAWLGDKRYPAATNVGVRPTIAATNMSVEAHLLDFDADIYGEDLALEFVQRIRPEQKFAGLPALKAQIDRDVTAVRDLLT